MNTPNGGGVAGTRLNPRSGGDRTVEKPGESARKLASDPQGTESVASTLDRRDINGSGGSRWCRLAGRNPARRLVF
jgi:hypothetical protein